MEEEEVEESEEDVEKEEDEESGAKSEDGEEEKTQSAAAEKSESMPVLERETSTPRPSRDNSVNALSFVKKRDTTEKVLQLIAGKLDNIDDRLTTLEREVKGVKRGESQEHKRGRRRVEEVDTLVDVEEDEFSDAHKELLDMGIVIDNRNKIHQKPVPGLRPVSDETDIRDLRPHPSINEKAIRDILRGEYCELETLIPPEHERISETNYEAYIEEGQLFCRVKEKKRNVDSLLTWLEAWSRYEFLMNEFHGSRIFRNLYEYKLMSISWCKKYKWYSVCEWDMQLRKKKGGKSIEFLDYDAGLFTYHFDHTTFKGAPSKKCESCGEKEHKGSPCPFQGGPGAKGGPGPKRRNEDNSWYERMEACHFFNTSRCYNRWCKRVHACKGCNGPMPYFECKDRGRCSYARY